MNKNNKKEKKNNEYEVLKCPDCGCEKLVKKSTKIYRFPKTHLFKFECGFAYLYNAKTEHIYLDVDWKCRNTHNSDIRVVPNKKFCKKYSKLSKLKLNEKPNKK
jgi:hypothetical protein